MGLLPLLRRRCLLSILGFGIYLICFRAGTLPMLVLIILGRSIARRRPLFLPPVQGLDASLVLQKMN